jgi:hypothetical protein
MLQITCTINELLVKVRSSDTWINEEKKERSLLDIID